MKRVFFYLLILICVSCRVELEVISAKKQTIIPGLKTEKNYYKYSIQLKSLSNENINVDRVVITQNNACYEVNFAIQKKGGAKLIKEIFSAGIYTITASLINDNSKIIDCDRVKNGLTIYYRERNQRKHFTIDSFVEEKKTMR